MALMPMPPIPMKYACEVPIMELFNSLTTSLAASAGVEEVGLQDFARSEPPIDHNCGL